MSDEPIDHRFTDEPVCPHCGFKDQDWWDGREPNQTHWETECGECGRTYLVWLEAEPNFCTEKGTES